MTITTWGDQHIIDTLESIRLPLNIYYNITTKLEKFSLQYLKKETKIIEEKPINIDNIYNIVVMVVIEDRRDISAHIEDLKSAGYYVILVVNKLGADIGSRTKNLADALLYRDNQGRDFGAYADISKFLYKKNHEHLKRIIFCNDSMYYARRNPQLFSDLINDDAPYIAMTASVSETVFFCHAYFFQLSGRLFRHKRMVRYFRRYLPVSSARYAVAHGEIAISRLIVDRLSTAPKIYFDHSQIFPSSDHVAKELDDQMGWLGMPNTENVIVKSARSPKRNGVDSSPLLWSIRSIETAKNAQTTKYLDNINQLDISQNLGIILFRNSSFPYIKRNMLSKGFVSLLQLSNSIGNEDYTKEILSMFIRNYGSYYGNPSWKRIFSFARLWGYV